MYVKPQTPQEDQPTGGQPRLRTTQRPAYGSGELPALPPLDISQQPTDLLYPHISELDTAVLIGPGAIVDERTRRLLLAGEHLQSAKRARSLAQDARQMMDGLYDDLRRMEHEASECVAEWDALRALAHPTAHDIQRYRLLTASIPDIERAIQHTRADAQRQMQAKRVEVTQHERQAALHQQAAQHILAGIGER